MNFVGPNSKVSLVRSVRLDSSLNESETASVVHKVSLWLSYIYDFISCFNIVRICFVYLNYSRVTVYTGETDGIFREV